MASRELSPSITAVTSGQSHTPGPWHVEPRNRGSFAIRAAYKTVCTGGYVYTAAPLAAHQANARLIAAAPDLLTALTALRDELCGVDYWWGDLREAAAAADTAIAKATGK